MKLEVDIEVRGAGTRETILDCGNDKGGFWVFKCNVSFSGFTMKNCRNSKGGAVRAEESKLVGKDLRFEFNTAPGVTFSGQGGALMALGTSSRVNFVNCTFESNFAGVGGALWLDNGIHSFKSCRFENNTLGPGGFGGAVVPDGNSFSAFDDCDFISNSAPFGGAVDTGTNSQSNYTNCRFKNNRSGVGGSFYSFGTSRATFEDCTFENETSDSTGGVFQVNSKTVVIVRRCTFKDCYAPSGAVVSATGGLYTIVEDCTFKRSPNPKLGLVPETGGHIIMQSNVTVKNCVFEDGRAIQGGSIYVLAPLQITITGCRFKGNTADSAGGAIYWDAFLDPDASATVRVKDCIFEDNKAKASGGAMLISGSSNVDMELEGCKFKSNKAKTGGAIATEKQIRVKFQDCDFTKNHGSTGGSMAATDETLVRLYDAKFDENSAEFGASLSQDLKGRFVVRNSSFTDGSADIQGGMLFSSILAKGCSSFRHVRIAGNEALLAGGGFYFDAKKPPCTDYCRDCRFQGNRAGYGDNYATAAAILRPDSPLDRDMRPSEMFDMKLTVTDFYNQSLHGFIDQKAVVSVKNDSFLRGPTEKQPKSDGTVSFKSLRWATKPSSDVVIRFETHPSTTAPTYSIDITRCGSNQVLFSDFDDDGERQHYCLTENKPSTMAQTLTYIFAALVCALAILVLGLLFWKRDSKPIRNASPMFCYLIVVGVILCAVSVTMWTKVSDGMCVLRGWLLSLGCSLIFGALFTREWRLLWMFKNKKVHRRILSDRSLLLGLSIIIVLNLVILIVWTSVAPPFETKRIEIGHGSDQDKITYECDVSTPSDVFIIILIVFVGILLAFDCTVAFFLRNLPSSFNESKFVAFTVYNSAIMMIVAITLIILFNNDKTAVLVVVDLCTLSGCLVTLLVLFGPKLYISFLNKERLAKWYDGEILLLQQEIWSRERQLRELNGATGKSTAASPTLNNSNSESPPDSSHSRSR